MDHWLRVGLAYSCWHYLLVLYLVCSAIRSSDHKLPLNLLTRSRCIWNHITARVKPTFVEWHRAPVDENDDADICDLSDVSDVDLQQHKLTHHHHHHHHHHIIICMKIGQTFFAEDQAQFSNVFQGKTMETSSWSSGTFSDRGKPLSRATVSPLPYYYSSVQHGSIKIMQTYHRMTDKSMYTIHTKNCIIIKWYRTFTGKNWCYERSR